MAAAYCNHRRVARKLTHSRRRVRLQVLPWYHPLNGGTRSVTSVPSVQLGYVRLGRRLPFPSPCCPPFPHKRYVQQNLKLLVKVLDKLDPKFDGADR